MPFQALLLNVSLNSTDYRRRISKSKDVYVDETRFLIDLVKCVVRVNYIR